MDRSFSDVFSRLDNCPPPEPTAYSSASWSRTSPLVELPVPCAAAFEAFDGADVAPLVDVAEAAEPDWTGAAVDVAEGVEAAVDGEEAAVDGEEAAVDGVGVVVSGSACATASEPMTSPPAITAPAMPLNRLRRRATTALRVIVRLQTSSPD